MIAVVYSGEIRDVGPGLFTRHALARMGIEHAYYWPQYHIPKGNELYVCVDDGRDDITFECPRPNVFWAVDTHLGYEARLKKARLFDKTYCAQKSGAERMRKDGVNAEWLPLACSPDHHPTAVEAGQGSSRYDVAFVGHLQDPPSTRLEVLDAVFKAVPNFRFEYGVFGADMAKVYHQAKVGLNHAIKNDLNMRFFELASMQVPQLCPNMEGLEDLGFRPWEDYIPYVTKEDAVAELRTALAAERPLTALAINAREKVRAGHTYEHRVKVLLGQ